jgi:hypothetical protein
MGNRIIIQNDIFFMTMIFELIMSCYINQLLPMANPRANI